MAELKTEPGWKPARRPWWVALVVGGISTGAGIGATLWLSSMQARGAEPMPVRTAGVAAAAQSDAEWRAEVTRTLSDVRERLARIEGRLERR